MKSEYPYVDARSHDRLGIQRDGNERPASARTVDNMLGII